MLDKLKEMTGGDSERMQLYISTYKEGVTEFIESLSAAYDLQDHGIAKDIAHAAKPLFTVMGFDSLWELANNLELAVHESADQDNINKMIKALIKKMSLSMEELKGI